MALNSTVHIFGWAAYFGQSLLINIVFQFIVFQPLFEGVNLHSKITRIVLC
jgi:hypothetical protein